MKSQNVNSTRLGGKWQRPILQWIAVQQGLKTTTDLEVFRQPKVVDALSAWLKKVEAGQFVVPTVIKRLSIPWQPERFLGHPPTRAESSALSRAVRTLAARGLIRKGGSGKRVMLALTPSGYGVLFRLWIEEAASIAKDSHKAEELSRKARYFEMRALDKIIQLQKQWK